MSRRCRLVRMFRVRDAQPPIEGKGTAVTQYIDDADGSTFAGGLVIFENTNMDWTVWYDELLFCHRVEGSFAVVVAGQHYDLGPGDSLWLPARTALTYLCEGRSWLFFSIGPANWRELRPKTSTGAVNID
jgi:ethanolamine utilization protein EutQ (cupin superfamily)